VTPLYVQHLNFISGNPKKIPSKQQLPFGEYFHKCNFRCFDSLKNRGHFIDRFIIDSAILWEAKNLESDNRFRCNSRGNRLIFSFEE